MRTFYNQGAAERRPRCECDSTPLAPPRCPLSPLPYSPPCPIPGYPPPPPPLPPEGPALTGWPALSQRLSGKGLPARMMQGSDTGCLSSTRTVGAPLAICGGAVGKERVLVTLDPRGHLWGQRLHPPRPREPAQEAGSPRIPGHGHICPKGWVVMGPGGAPWVSHLPPPQIHQRTVSSHQEPGLRLDLPKDILCFTDIWGLVFRDHT